MHRNVILICTDQWRGDALSIEGHPRVKTPYLDELADRGARAERAYSASPTCIPARMSLLTGLAAENHGRVGYQDGIAFDIATTMAGAFSQAGYHTQAIGKMHLWPERVRAGFDDVLLHDGYLHHSRRRERDPRTYDDYLTWLRREAGEDAVSDYLDDGLHCNSMVARPWQRAERLHPTNWIVSSAIDWLYRRDPTVPFFLYLSFHRPHPPYDPPQWAFDMYLNRPPHQPPVGDWVEVFEPWRNDHRADSHVADYPMEDQHRAQAGYYGNMSHIDAQIERFLQVLGEFGLAQDSFVAFTSDHGEMMGDHHLWRKGYPYEGSARIPFLLSGPGIPEQSVIREVIELRDVMPTLLDCAEVEIPEGLDGASVLPLIAAATDADWRDHLHGEHAMMGGSFQWIRSGDWKYIWISMTGDEQLFNLAEDPDEVHDLSGEEAYADRLAALREILVRRLAGREEGFVRDGRLVTGVEAPTARPFAGQQPVRVEHPTPQSGIPAP
ncbi:arylsulfatase [Enemella evansiae]|uniref:arylsulfatase n=1 Tax=Enemella evansiae TaxID=2016499 RepID=UPI000B96DE98|nr:arylsulfatase [Enemella evansiae]OYO04855.1 arylsulfatase [Enemella evansiae]